MNVFSVVGWISKDGHRVELAARVARARLVLEADAAQSAPVTLVLAEIPSN